MTLLAVAMMLSSMVGQEQVDEAGARARLVKQVDPVYPARARSAHLVGDVVVQVKVDPRGRVATAKAVSGAPILRQPAVDAVKQWVFTPEKQDGVLTSFETQVTVAFPVKQRAMRQAAGAGTGAPEVAPVEAAGQGAAPAAAAPASAAPAGAAQKAEERGGPGAGPDAVQTRYVTLALTCKRLVTGRGEPKAQAKACAAAAEEGEKLGEGWGLAQRRAAYVYAATASMRNQQYGEATGYGGKAVSAALEAHDAGAGASAAYAVKGQAEAFDGDFKRANGDLAEAEKLERAALAAPGGKAVAGGLKQLLNLRSQVLMQMGSKDEARRLRAEAEKL